jgi:two-component system response regulator AtoC
MSQRYLVLRGRSTALRLALPALDRLTVGAASTCEVRVDEPGVAPEHAVLFLDRDVALKVLDPETARLRPGRGGALDEEPLSVGATVELADGDRLRLGALELILVGEGEVEARVHPVSRATFEAEVEARQRDPERPSLAVVRLRAARAQEAERFQEALVGALPPRALVAELGRGDVAVLLEGVTEFGARRAIHGALERVLEAGLEGLVGLAEGHEGRPADLLELAKDRLSRPMVGAERGRGLIAQAPAMQRLVRLLERAARSPAPVLLLGETGVGKELVAQLLHEKSERAEGPYVRVSAATLSDTFLEDPAGGFLARARGGTVHLDEVGGLTPRAQLSLGYLLDEPLATHDVRVVASSNLDLVRAVERGTFRKDLLFRLNQVTLTVPPLCERVEDIGALASLFLEEAARARGEPAPRLSRSALAALEGHAWPGNVRELRSVIERALLACSSDLMEVEHLELSGVGEPAPFGEGLRGERTVEVAERAASVPAVAPSAAGKRPSLREELAALEKQRIIEALDRYPTQREAAEALEMPMRTFLNRLDEFGIPRARGGGKKPNEP